ncbi:hypothetical protein [Streptomyces anulatus]|uniref:hypothetical protein n=1 Tax=Streptomyces anulatus TaxID=1892 RepID=UPI002F92B9FA|nr:hypothetical protein OHB50_39900 [Streptomyces anulatus]
MNRTTPLRRAVIRRRLTTYAVEAAGWTAALFAFSQLAPRIHFESALVRVLVWGAALVLTRTCVVVYLRDRLGLKSEEEHWRQELQG